MRARLVPFALMMALCSCSSRADKQLEAVKSARSVIAEWALVEEQAAAGRAQSAYVGQMRELAKDQLKTDEQELSQQPDAAALIGSLRSHAPDAGALKRAADALKPLENSLETA